MLIASEFVDTLNDAPDCRVLDPELLDAEHVVSLIAFRVEAPNEHRALLPARRALLLTHAPIHLIQQLIGGLDLPALAEIEAPDVVREVDLLLLAVEGRHFGELGGDDPGRDVLLLDLAETALQPIHPLLLDHDRLLLLHFQFRFR